MVLADSKAMIDDSKGISTPTDQKPGNTFARIISHPAFHIAVLLGLVLYCSVRGLKGYFLADDFGQVLYVSKALHGEPQRILRNWTGHLMDIPSMAIYRPWFFMSLLFDFALWQG